MKLKPKIGMKVSITHPFHGMSVTMYGTIVGIDRSPMGQINFVWVQWHDRDHGALAYNPELLEIDPVRTFISEAEA